MMRNHCLNSSAFAGQLLCVHLSNCFHQVDEVQHLLESFTSLTIKRRQEDDQSTSTGTTGTLQGSTTNSGLPL